MRQTTSQFLAITQSFCKAKQNMRIAFSISRQRLTSGRKKTFLENRQKWQPISIIYCWWMGATRACLCAARGLRTFTFPQICRPERRGRCCGSEVSLRCAAASDPSGGWRWKPASLAPPKAPTLTGCRSAHPRCQPDAWKVKRTGRGAKQNTVSNATEANVGELKMIKYLSWIYEGSKANPGTVHQIISLLM